MVKLMADLKIQLETLAYLAMHANSPSERRELDELLRQTETQIDESEVRETVAA